MLTLAVAQSISSVSSRTAQHASTTLDPVMLFGFLSVFCAMVFFIYHEDSRLSRRVFAMCLVASAIYGLYQGAYGLSAIVLLWSLSAFRDSRNPRNVAQRETVPTFTARGKANWDPQSRLTRMFGPI